MSDEKQQERVSVELIKDKIVIDMLQERKGERRWRWIRRIGFGAMFVFAVGMSLVNQIKQSGGWTATGRRSQ